MNSPEEIITTCLEDKKELSDTNGVLKDIDDILDFIRAKSFDDHMKYGDLARLAWNLSVIMFNLGEMVAEYMAFANANYIYRKFKYNEAYSNIRTEFKNLKVGESERLAEKQTSEQYEQQIKTRYLADLLKTKYDECNRMVMVIQSVMKKEKDEYLRSGEITK